jgi:hypothetical protein
MESYAFNSAAQHIMLLSAIPVVLNTFPFVKWECMSNCKQIFLFSSRHLQRFWGASGDFWQAQWDRLLDVIGEDSFTFWVYGKLNLE